MLVGTNVRGGRHWSIGGGAHSCLHPLGVGSGSEDPEAENERVQRVLIIMIVQTLFLFYACRIRFGII